jgi:hypothetical protein
MADLAQILLLPPPAPFPQRLPLSSTGRDQELAVNTETQGGGDTARGKRFRFRVYEGSESSQTTTDLATRRTDTRAGLINNGSVENATAESSSRRGRYASAGSHAASSSAFLAQSFAQEQLGEGLHNPPYAAATAAYGRTGAAVNPRASAGLDIRA